MGICVDKHLSMQNYKDFYDCRCLLWAIRHMSTIMQWVSMLINVWKNWEEKECLKLGLETMMESKYNEVRTDFSQQGNGDIFLVS